MFSPTNPNLQYNYIFHFKFEDLVHFQKEILPLEIPFFLQFQFWYSLNQMFVLVLWFCADSNMRYCLAFFTLSKAVKVFENIALFRVWHQHHWSNTPAINHSIGSTHFFPQHDQSWPGPHHFLRHPKFADPSTPWTWWLLGQTATKNTKGEWTVTPFGSGSAVTASLRNQSEGYKSRYQWKKYNRRRLRLL